MVSSNKKINEMPINKTFDISEYTFDHQPIYSGEHTVILKGIRNQDQQKVALKILNNDKPSLDAINRMKREYEIAKLFTENNIIQTYFFTKYENAYGIVMEYLHFPTLSEIIEQRKKLTIEDFFWLSLSLLKAIGTIHDQQIIHKDITPFNIMCDFTQKKIWIIDFGLSATLSKEHTEIVNPNTLEGTLAYLAPEQTGRMNRGIDYRTDFYSLGIVFYQLLTGKLPFSSQDAMEFVYHHIAVSPVPPHEIDAGVPEMLSRIVMKMLAKNAEDRYQNVNGMIADIEKCQEKWLSTGKIEDFQLAEQDIYNRFQIPEKLYGRENELESLIKAYQKAMKASSALMLVTGYSGIGKSSLVHEFLKVTVKDNGYFVSGKFDQYKRNIPYTAITAAFDELVKQILAEPEDKILYFKEKILAAVGNNGKLLTEVVPSLVSIIGEQSDVIKLNPTESNNRFVHIFQSFIQVLCTKEHPLIFFLDDLQWADSSSLKMLETLLTSFDIQYLFIICAYRDNEASYLLTNTVEKLDKQGVPIESIHLGHLSKDHVAAILSDTLHQETSKVNSLTEIIYKKTNGNPFFLIQMLFSFYVDNLITFNNVKNSWEWDLPHIEEKKITDNVVEFLIDKIRETESKTQEILEYAACIGNKFSLPLLASILEKEIEDINSDFQEALKTGYVLSIGESFKASNYYFSHDRIQQAAYSLISEEKRKLIHIKIARALLQDNPDNVLDIANQYNLGLEYAEEKKQIMELNLKASIISRESAAFEAALTYIETGIKLANEVAENDRNLKFNLYSQANKCAYLCAKYDLTDEYAKKALESAPDILSKLKITQEQIHSSVSQLKSKEAIQFAIKILAETGIVLPKNPKSYHALYYLIKTMLLLRNRTIDQLLNLPPIDSEVTQTIIELIVSVYSAAFQNNQNIFAIFVCITVQLSIQHGNGKGSSGAYNAFASLLNGILGDVEKGYDFGKLSSQLVEKNQDEECRTQVNFGNLFFLKHWKDPIKDSLTQCLDNFDIGLDRGDLEFGSLSIGIYMINSITAGLPLQSIMDILCKYKAIIKQYGQIPTIVYLSMGQQLISNLQSTQENPMLLVGEYYDEHEMFEKLKSADQQVGLDVHYFYKTMLQFYFGESKNAFLYLKSSEKPLISSTIFSSHHFIKVLILLSLYHDFSFFDKARYLLTIRSIIKKFAKWSKLAPANQLHRYLLLQAEYQYRIKKNRDKAAILYNQAIEAAKNNEFLNEEALANELAAKFYLVKGNEQVARVYIENARYAYLCWGANAKVEHLNKTYSHLLRQNMSTVSAPTGQTTFSSAYTKSTISETLDTDTLYKSSVAISSTIVLSELLKKLMQIVTENAGAQRSILLLSQNNEFFIEAEKTLDHETSLLQSTPLTPEHLPITLINYVAHSKNYVVLGNTSKMNRFITDPYIVKYKPLSVLAFPLINQSKCVGILYFENNLAENAFTSNRIDTLNFLSSQIVISIENARLYERTKQLNNSFERFLPADFLNLLKKNTVIDIQLGDRIQEIMTIVFVDIRNFTTLSEKMSPAENFYFINNFLKMMGPLIRKHHGFIDKYIGDAIMALFPKRAEEALLCALEMQSTLEKYNQSNDAPIHIGIGINTGLLMLGIVGEESRMNATVISDAVNIASRVESLTKVYEASILITEETYNNLPFPEKFNIQRVDRILVKGKEKEITIYEVISDPLDSRPLMTPSFSQNELGNRKKSDRA